MKISLSMKDRFYQIKGIYLSFFRYTKLFFLLFVGRVRLGNTQKYNKRCAVLYKVPQKPKRHSNDTEVEIIHRVFNDLGYAVDLYDYKSAILFPFFKYDCIFGFGDLFDQICCTRKKPTMIHYLTGRPQWLSDSAECLEVKRIREFVSVDTVRYMNRSGAASLYLADHVAYVGRGKNFDEMKTIRRDAAGVRLAAQAPEKRILNLARDRKKVLFFGSVGAVHKGIFKYLEVASLWSECFPNIDMEWGVIGDFNRDEIAAIEGFPRPLPEKLIIFGGLSSPGASEFYSEAAYIINPSTSEGCCTSLIESIRCGFIPLYSSYSGIDGGLVRFLEADANIAQDYVRILEKLVQMNDREHLNLVYKSQSLCEEHSIENFRCDITSFLKSSLG